MLVLLRGMTSNDSSVNFPGGVLPSKTVSIIYMLRLGVKSFIYLRGSTIVHMTFTIVNDNICCI